jgi:putative flippase GtrA
MLSGGPAFFLAMILNFLLVEFLHIPIPVAYCAILIFQLLLNFVIIKLFVFKSGGKLFDLKEMLAFFSGVLGFRVLDLALYTFLTTYSGVYFMYAQVGNMVLFSIGRFLFAEKIIDKKQ